MNVFYVHIIPPYKISAVVKHIAIVNTGVL